MSMPVQSVYEKMDPCVYEAAIGRGQAIKTSQHKVALKDTMSAYGKMDPCVDRAATYRGQSIEDSKLEAALNDMAQGTSLLLLASRVGNSEFVKKVLELKPHLLKAINDEENTALHEAAEGGHSEVVEILLQRDHDKSLLSMTNKRKETVLFKSCQGCELCNCCTEPDHLNPVKKLLFKCCHGCQVCGCRKECKHLTTVKTLLDGNPTTLRQKTQDGKTCLHVAVIKGNSGLLDFLLQRIKLHSFHEIVKEADDNGETSLHLAVRRNHVKMVRQLEHFESKLCCYVNKESETPLFIAVKMGFVEIADELIKFMPNTIQIPNKTGKNVLHEAVELNQVKLVEILVEKGVIDLTWLINQPIQAADSKQPNNQPEGSGGTGDNNCSVSFSLPLSLSLTGLINQPIQAADSKQPNNQPEGSGGTGDNNCSPREWSGRAGDTPLHIAARNKNFPMVNLLLEVPGVNKDAFNNEGLTPLDIARENTEYHESYKIIEKLANYPPKCRPFMYCAPKVTPEKRKNAVEIIEKTYDARRNTELVVAALLATMTFTAAFSVPGGFQTEIKKTDDVLGTPLLIGYDTFKLFLICDYVAFFLSLFVVLIWQLSTPLTTGDKILLMTITSLLVCVSFGFTAYGFMAAAYAMLAHKVKKMAWIVLGASIFIIACCSAAFVYLASIFTIKRARYHRLCGVPRGVDNIVKSMWLIAERWGILDYTRRCDQILRDFFTLGRLPKRIKTTAAAVKSAAAAGTRSACLPAQRNPV